ncbi:MAG: division/cell wall cluster transcriptional repressor MraZ [Candidatus Pacebacteria bacterium]|nr:division/cell wall cluster transcriptional repressor MraZ [Candidatus Paceibacterota bacterium]
MLIGEYTHTLDLKKRVSLPAKFRAAMGKTMILAKGLDHCISIYSPKEWKEVMETLPRSIQEDPRRYKRHMTSGASDVNLDSLGRILVPDFLKTYAKLKVRVVLVGVGDHIEIWDEKTWKVYRDKSENSVEMLAEKLGENGFV